MASPGQRRGVCGHAMAGFVQHTHCAHCREKKGSDPCVKGSFYYATIAYHVGLIAVLGWPQGIMANV